MLGLVHQLCKLAKANRRLKRSTCPKWSSSITSSFNRRYKPCLLWLLGVTCPTLPSLVSSTSKLINLWETLATRANRRLNRRLKGLQDTFRHLEQVLHEQQDPKIHSHLLGNQQLLLKQISVHPKKNILRKMRRALMASSCNLRNLWLLVSKLPSWVLAEIWGNESRNPPTRSHSASHCWSRDYSSK